MGLHLESENIENMRKNVFFHPGMFNSCINRIIKYTLVAGPFRIPFSIHVICVFLIIILFE